jgi:hypothetical protein
VAYLVATIEDWVVEAQNLAEVEGGNFHLALVVPMGASFEGAWAWVVLNLVMGAVEALVVACSKLQMAATGEAEYSMGSSKIAEVVEVLLVEAESFDDGDDDAVVVAAAVDDDGVDCPLVEPVVEQEHLQTTDAAYRHATMDFERQATVQQPIRAVRPWNLF